MRHRFNVKAYAKTAKGLQTMRSNMPVPTPGTKFLGFVDPFAVDQESARPAVLGGCSCRLGDLQGNWYFYPEKERHLNGMFDTPARTALVVGGAIAACWMLKKAIG